MKNTCIILIIPLVLILLSCTKSFCNDNALNKFKVCESTYKLYKKCYKYGTEGIISREKIITSITEDGVKKHIPPPVIYYTIRMCMSAYNLGSKHLPLMPKNEYFKNVCGLNITEF